MKHRISIFASDKNLYSVKDFKNHSDLTPIGIAIQTETRGIVMSLKEWQLPWAKGSCNNLQVSEAEAILRTSGYEDTLDAYNHLKDKTEKNAITQCFTYNFGEMQWYLPCLQELSLIWAYRKEINKVLRELSHIYSCDVLQEENCYWSSAQYSSYYAWDLDWIDGYVTSYYKNYSSYVRAICGLYPLESMPIENTITEESAIAFLHQCGYEGTLTKKEAITL